MTDGWVGTRGGREEFQGKLQIADQMMGGVDDSSVNWQQRESYVGAQRGFGAF